MLRQVKLTGFNSDHETALAYTSSDQKLFIVMVCQGEDVFSRSRQAIFSSEDKFLASEHPVHIKLATLIDWLEDSVKGAQWSQVVVGYISDLEQGQLLHLMYNLKGDNPRIIEADLIRSSQETDLLSLGRSSQAISGPLHIGDRVIVTTKSLHNLLEDSDWPRVTSKDITSLPDEISLLLPAGEVYPLAAVIIDSFDPEVKDQHQPAERSDEAMLPIPRSDSLPTFRLPDYLTRTAILVGIGILLLGLLAGGFYYRRFRQVLPTATSRQSVSPSPGSVSGLPTVNLTDLPLWLDLSLIKTGLNIQTLSLSVGKLALLDSGQKTLVTLDLIHKSPQILAGQDKLGQAQVASINGSAVFVYSQDKGIVSVDIGSKTVDNPIKVDSEWGKIADLYAFSSNIYLLDTIKNQVWKYLPVASGYSDRLTYLSKDTKAEFSTAKKLQIDGSVWVLKSTGTLTKYTQGAEDFFSIGGLDKPLHSIDNFFTSSETQNIYLLDKTNKRLIVADKTGKVQMVYQSDSFSAVSDLIVDEPGKKGYLLIANKIYSFDLR